MTLSLRKNRTPQSFQPFCPIALLVGSLVGAWHPLVTSLVLAVEKDAYTHILLILPLSLTFICVEWKLLRLLVKPSIVHGTLLLCVAGVIAGLPRWQTARLTSDLWLAIDMLALVTWWIGSFVLCFGRTVSRSTLFPLCFLYWMVPFPSFVLNEIIKSLQQGSALVTRFLFTFAGVPVAQDGLMISIPGLTVEVAKECSSIRSSLMLLVTTMALAQLLLRSPWRKLLVIVLAIPLSVAKNGLRIFSLAMLGTKIDPGFLNGRLHHHGGIVFFAVALSVIFFLLWILRRTERDATRAAVVHRARPEMLTTVSSG